MGILGQPIRIVQEDAAPRLYLTFDDGPHPVATPALLHALERHSIAATFFLIGLRAQKEPSLVREVLGAGHGIGNHSLDHAYGHYFRGMSHVRTWINAGEQALANLSGRETVGFRPPAGIRTPEVARAVRDLNMPLVLWRMRFFDSVIPWRPAWAVRSLAATPPGSIVLLHDAQSAGRLPAFVDTLDAYVTAAKARGFTFGSLSRRLLLSASGMGKAPNTPRNT